MQSTKWVVATVFIAGCLPSASLAAQFFATQVVDYSPGPGVTAGQGFGIPARILGGPRGGGPLAGSLDVLTLGVHGQVTVGFDSLGVTRRIVDQPGPDFIVFENPFYIGGNTNSSFSELAFVEISSDGVHFARFLSHSANAGPVGPNAGIDPSKVSGLAGVHSALANVDTNTNDPFDPSAAGGDAFDLSDLANDPAVVAGQVNLRNIRYVRIIDILGDGAAFDSLGNPIYDPTGLNNSCDIDAAGVFHGCAVGDVDGNGTIDAGDAAALVTLLLQANSVTANVCADLNADGTIDGEDIPLLLQALLSGP